MPVLVVDDVPLIRSVVRAVLDQIGVRDVHEAPDGTALTMLNAHAYGLVIWDLHMFPTSGFELLRRVRDDRRLREALFVIMTTKEHAHAFTTGRREGVSRQTLHAGRSAQDPRGGLGGLTALAARVAPAGMHA